MIRRASILCTLGTILTMFIAAPLESTAAVPRPEHPRPDLRRETWLNLNGRWDFAFDPGDQGTKQEWFKPDSEAFDHTILVPYPWESPLSGVECPDYKGVAWYRRAFEVPKNWTGSRIFIVFGAVDWECQVWVDGVKAGENIGGYTPFEVELTNRIEPGQTHTVVVRVVDFTEHTQPVGKQVNWYTRTSGIWQTVYLEARGIAYIEKCHFIPGVREGEGDTNRLDNIKARFAINDAQPGDLLVITSSSDPEQNAVDEDSTYQAQFHDDIAIPAETAGVTDTEITLDDPQLWSPESPNLYFVRVELQRDGIPLDSVTTYFGLRDIAAKPFRNSSRANDRGLFEYVYLNDEPIYLRGALDQSFHPMGVYTWPDDNAIQYDLDKTLEFGLNFLRMHIKIEEPRFLYWADRKGVLLQCDLPSFWKWSEESKQHLETLFDRVIDRDMSHPSIFSWVLINETWGLEKHDTKESQEWLREFYHRAKKTDPSRLIEDNSPCRYDHVETDLNSWHFYIFDPKKAKKHIDDLVTKIFPGSETNYIGGNKQGTEPFLNSEYGGVSAGSGDRDISWCIHYLTQYLRRHEIICGFIYTELQDIEWEHNGLMNYDRSAKVFGYDEFVPLPEDESPFNVADIFEENFLGTDLDPLHVCEPGQTLEIPIWLARFDEVESGIVNVDGRLTGMTVLGETVDIPLESISHRIDRRGVHNLGIMQAVLPDMPMAGVIGIRCADRTGETVARGFATFQSLRNDAPRSEAVDAKKFVRRWRPNDLLIQDDSSKDLEVVLDGWKVSKEGAAQLAYEILLPEEVVAAGIGGIQFTAELGARAGRGKIDWSSRAKEGDYPQTETSKRWPSKVLVKMNGRIVGSAYLDDDPADVRGFLSNLTNEHPSSYGYLTTIRVGKEDLGALEEDLRKMPIIRLELVVPEGTPVTGGLSVYGERAGRYPIDPQIVIETKNEVAN